MRLRGIPPAGGVPAVSFVNSPNGSIIGSAVLPVGKLITIVGAKGSKGDPGDSVNSVRVNGSGQIVFTRGIVDLSPIATDSGLLADPDNPGLYIANPTGGFVALNDFFPLEGMPVFLYGHSYLASDMYNSGAGSGGRWAGRVASRARMGTVTTRATNGRRSDQMSRDIVTGTNVWIPKTRGAVFMTCTVNDVTQLGNAATAVRQYGWAWTASLSLLRAKAKYAANTTDFVYSSSTTWAENTSNTPMGGKRLQTATVGDYFEFAVTGDTVDVYLTARSTGGAGLATFTVGGVTVGTLDLTSPSFTDFALAVANLTGLGAGDHTVRGTLTSGAYLGVEGITIASESPPLVVVYGEGPILNYGSHDVTTYNGYLTGTYLPVLVSVCAAFPGVVYVPSGGGWDTTTMIRTDAVVTGDQLIHPNDRGASYIAGRVLSAMSALGWSNGLNTLGTQPTYTTPTPPATPPGGRTGAAIIISTISDDFNRADSTTTLGVTSVGALTWNALAGTWGISSNKGYCVTGTEATAVVDTSFSDGAFEVTVSNTSGELGGGACLAFRFVDNGNGWLLYGGSFGSPGAGFWRLAKKVAGGFTFYAPSVNVTPVSGDVLHVDVSGSSITAKVNGSTVATMTDSAFSTATQHGLRANPTIGVNPRFDTFSAVAG